MPVDARGAPLPLRGLHWSLTHGGELVAGAIAPCALGLDLEPVRLASPAVLEAAASAEELALASDAPREARALAFTRVWTAKEAVLKLAGCGLGELSRARLVARQAPEIFLLRHRERTRRVRVVQHEGHVLALVLEEDELLEHVRLGFLPARERVA